MKYAVWVGPRNTFFPQKIYFTKEPPGDEIDIETRVLVPFLSNLVKDWMSTGQKLQGQPEIYYW